MPCISQSINLSIRPFVCSSVRPCLSRSCVRLTLLFNLCTSACLHPAILPFAPSTFSPYIFPSIHSPLRHSSFRPGPPPSRTTARRRSLTPIPAFFPDPSEDSRPPMRRMKQLDIATARSSYASQVQPPTTPSNPSPNYPQLQTFAVCLSDAPVRRCTQLCHPSRVSRTFAFPCTSPSQRRVHRTADRRPAPKEKTPRSEPPCPRFAGVAAFTTPTSQTSKAGWDGPYSCSAPGKTGLRSCMEYACTGTNRL